MCGLGRLLRLFDTDGACRRRQHGFVTVVPADTQTRRILGDDLLDDASPRLSRDTLGLDHDSVSRMRFHSVTSSGPTLPVSARAVRASRRASRRGSSVRVRPAIAVAAASAISASVRHAAWTASGLVPGRVLSQ